MKKDFSGMTHWYRPQIREIPIIDNIQSAFKNYLSSGDLFTIKLLIDKNIIDVTDLDSLLKDNVMSIRNVIIANYFVNSYL
jgi:hypothetical protein